MFFFFCFCGQKDRIIVSSKLKIRGFLLDSSKRSLTNFLFEMSVGNETRMPICRAISIFLESVSRLRFSLEILLDIVLMIVQTSCVGCPEQHEFV